MRGRREQHSINPGLKLFLNRGTANVGFAGEILGQSLQTTCAHGGQRSPLVSAWVIVPVTWHLNLGQI